MGIEYKGNQGSKGKRLDPKRKDALDLILMFLILERG